jgi:hypothetical protein
MGEDLGGGGGGEVRMADKEFGWVLAKLWSGVSMCCACMLGRHSASIVGVPHGQFHQLCLHGLLEQHWIY